MKPIKILLAGAGGYGNVYVEYFRQGRMERENARLAGVADPFAEKAPGYAWLQENKIPIYSTPADFFRENQADLTIIATPTNLHSPYSITAMENGSHVLCEKPLTPTLQELDALEQERKRLDRQLGVGFQWSFSQTMGRLKEDILAGVYGRPKMLKTFISWPRALSYYGSSTWKGRVRDGKGGYILDSIVTNAAAHYLHNIFFLLGSTMETAAYPERVEAELYRAKQIESFDTCILRGCAGGGRFLYVASHATQLNLEPSFCYEFEKGAVVFNQDAQDNCVTGRLSDGRTIVYGDPFTNEEIFQKCRAMLDYIRTGQLPRCTISTVRPHLLTCNAVFDYGRVTDFPHSMLAEEHMDDPKKANLCCPGLYEDLLSCYQDAALPSEKGFPWSAPAALIPVADYKKFLGGAF